MLTLQFECIFSSLKNKFTASYKREIQCVVRNVSIKQTLKNMT